MAYFKDRFIAETERLFTISATATEAEIAKQYTAAYKKINDQLRIMYNDIKSANITSVSELYRYQNYYDLLNLLNEELDSLSIAEIGIIEPRFTSLYNAQSRYLARSFGLGGTIRKDIAKSAVNAYWCGDGKCWSDRIWSHRAQLASVIEQGVVDCAVRGASTAELTGMLRDTFGVSFNEASRLVRTEMSYIQNRAAADKYAEAGIEYYEIIDTGDDRECDDCAALTGRRFRLEDAQPGVNFPPLHPHCRCAIIAILPEEEQKHNQYRKQGETPAGVVKED